MSVAWRTSAGTGRRNRGPDASAGGDGTPDPVPFPPAVFVPDGRVRWSFLAGGPRSLQSVAASAGFDGREGPERAGRAG